MKLNGIRGQLSFTPSLCLGGGGQLLARRDIQQFVSPNSQNYFNALKFGMTDIPLKGQPGRTGRKNKLLLFYYLLSILFFS